MSKINQSIYCIISHSAKSMYIGATTQSTRFSKHKSHYKRYKLGKNSCAWYSVFDILDNDDAEYYILTEVDGDKTNLHMKERSIIKEFKKTSNYKIVNKLC